VVRGYEGTAKNITLPGRKRRLPSRRKYLESYQKKNKDGERLWRGKETEVSVEVRRGFMDVDGGREGGQGGL